MIRSTSTIALNDDIEEKERRGIFVAKLHNGEPFFETPISPHYLSQKNSGLSFRYCDSQGLLALRESIARKYNNSFSEERVIVTHGAVGGINLALTTILEAGDEVIVIEPFWPQYAALAELRNAKIVRAQVDLLSGKISKNKLDLLITKNTKLLVLNNPVNPTGVVYSESEMAEIISLCGRGIYILVDEVYGKYLYDIQYKPLVEQQIFNDYAESVIYVNSFSKEYGMTGLRVGYCIIPERLKHRALGIFQQTMTCISPLSQLACIEVLKEKSIFKAVFERALLTLKHRKKILEDEFVSKKIAFISGAGAFYLFADVGTDSRPIVADLYRNHSIALVAGSDYGEGFENYLRICYSTDERSFEIFMNYLLKFGLSSITR